MTYKATLVRDVVESSYDGVSVRRSDTAEVEITSETEALTDFMANPYVSRGDWRIVKIEDANPRFVEPVSKETPVVDERDYPF